jgi:hypothetical protein
VALLRLTVVTVLSCFVLAAAPAAAQPAPRVSVQPIDGEAGPALRQLVVRLLRARGYRVVTNIARVDGTGQYLSLARDHRLNAFVTGDVEQGKHRSSITFLVWDGATGSVVGRWSASAPAKRMGAAIGKGFWKHLGSAFDGAQPPPSDELPEAPPMRIDAGTPLD